MRHKSVLNQQAIKLPQPKYDGKTSVEKALLERRSVRGYNDEPLTLAEVSQLLWAAQGITDSARSFRTSPSAGALYPLELYIVAGNVTDLSRGVYKYKPHGRELIEVMEGDRRADLCNVVVRQSLVKDAAAVIVFTAVYQRTTVKYGERGTRYAHMEVGCAAQNVYLQAISLELGTVFIGAFDDDKTKKVLNMPEEEQPLGMMPVGRKQNSQ
ncbi:MAG: SagB/ThcOx family dehydrogenase [Candidatus Eisenbacteria bacterium]|nr:SagB/ThcOx family dehydrogenase [Candidatus Eisenbacteria bacterium]